MDANAILFAIALGVLLAGVPSFGFWLQRLPGYLPSKYPRIKLAFEIPGGAYSDNHRSAS
jgi:hypothetical protein